MSNDSDELLNRVIALARQPWLDPDQRCATVTIALALLVCSKEVSIAEPVRGIQTLAYKNIAIRLAADVSQPYGVFSVVSAFGSADASLTKIYASEENNKDARNLLNHLEGCREIEQRAAVLGLAWVRLVKGHASITQEFRVSRSADGGGGSIHANGEYGLYIREDRGKVVEAHFPFLE